MPSSLSPRSMVLVFVLSLLLLKGIAPISAFARPLDLSWSLSARGITATLSLLLLAIAALLLKRLTRRPTKESASWVLKPANDSLAKRSLKVLMESILRKSGARRGEAYLITIVRGGEVYLQLCVYGDGLRPYVDGLLSTLEPEVKSFPGKLVECPRWGPDLLPRRGGSLGKELNEALLPDVPLLSSQDPSDDEKVLVGCTPSGRTVALSLSELYRHVGVFGSTGSGKTTTCVSLAARLAAQGARVVVIDWHGEYARLLPSSLAEVVEPLSARASLNPLTIDDRESLLEMLEDVFDLTQPQTSVLSSVVREAKKPSSLQELLYLLHASDDNGYWNRELRMAIARRLDPLDSPEGRVLFGGRSGFKLPESGKVMVVDVSRISSTRLRKLYVLSFLRMLFFAARNSGPLSVFVVLDEAHNVLPKDTENFVARMLAEVRKLGVGLIISTQSPSSVNAEFLKNINTKIVHRVVSGIDRRILVESIGGSEELWASISALEPGEAFFSSPSIPGPVRIRVVPYPFERCSAQTAQVGLLGSCPPAANR